MNKRRQGQVDPATGSTTLESMILDFYSKSQLSIAMPVNLLATEAYPPTSKSRYTFDILDHILDFIILQSLPWIFILERENSSLFMTRQEVLSARETMMVFTGSYHYIHCSLFHAITILIHH